MLNRTQQADVTSVTSSATVVTLAEGNKRGFTRMGLAIANSSTARLYVKLGTGASATDFTVVIPPMASDIPGYWEMPDSWGYCGPVTGIWSAANGSAKVTEVR